MKKLFLIAVLFSQFIFYSCSDEASITNCEKDKDDIEIIAEKLAAVIDERNPDMAFVYIYDEQNNKWVFKGGCNGFKLDPPFIRVCGDYYHLKNLAKYSVGSGFKLYFNY